MKKADRLCRLLRAARCVRKRLMRRLFGAPEASGGVRRAKMRSGQIRAAAKEICRRASEYAEA